MLIHCCQSFVHSPEPCFMMHIQSEPCFPAYLQVAGTLEWSDSGKLIVPEGQAIDRPIAIVINYQSRDPPML